jgi:FkbM family methyltransferase
MKIAMNFEEKISVALDDSLKSKHTALTSMLEERKSGIYVIGKNEQSAEIIKKYKTIGLIDDYNDSEVHWNGIPIVKSRDIDSASIIVNCVTSVSPVLVRDNLHAAGFDNLVSVSDLISEKTNLLPIPWFVSEQRNELKQNRTWWSDLYRLMSDKTSKKTLTDVLRFRLTANFEYMNDYTVRLRDQYFENFMGYRNEVFVDAGGFDGDTTEEFISRYPDYKRVYFFEPSKKNLKAAKQRLLGRRDIDFSLLGLSSSNGILYFNADAGSASAVSDGDGDSISVATLDSVLENRPVSFIKMDLEGWEMNALCGSELTIRKNKPKLAIAVYHSAKDFREIPKFILSLNPNYKIFLRHYTQGWSETVMYFK